MNSQRGFSLVELMVAMALGLFITGAVSAVFVTSSQTYRTQDSMARLQENARFALSNMQEDIRSAGFRGCLGGTNTTLALAEEAVKINLSPADSFSNNFAVGVQGFESSGSGWVAASDTTVPAMPTLTPTPTADSDVITLRLADGGAAVNAAMSNATDAIPVASSSGFAVGDAAMIADCGRSTVFRVTGVGGSSISHGTDLGKKFGTGASVMPLSVITYFVGPSSNATGNGETSLWQQFDGVNFELADGVEKMQVLYGEDTDCVVNVSGFAPNCDRTPNKYVTANNVSDFSRVVAVKISLLMRTVENNISAAGQNYTFNGQNETPGTGDRYVRRAFTTTVTLRNRTS